jgi:acetylcholinesterase
LLQYTDWEHLGDGYLNQRKIAEVVGDYFFICPTNRFAEDFASRGARIYYYDFTQVRLVIHRPVLPTLLLQGEGRDDVFHVLQLLQFV